MSVSRTHVPSSILGPNADLVPDDHPFRREFRRWLADNCEGLPEPLDLDEKLEVRRAWQRQLFDGGWAGPAWPAEHGGRGAGPLEQFMYYEELALARAPQAANTPGVILLGPTLMIHGTEELKARFLPGILSGDEIWSQGFSEPNAGSDLAALRTRARRDGDEWVIDGQKTWTTWAHYSDWCFVLCRTDPDSQRHRGLTLVICPMDQPGVTCNPVAQISGDAEFGEVFFDSARASAELIVGEPGEGWAAAMTMFQFERADVGFTDHARLLVLLADIATELREGAADVSPAVRAPRRARIAELWTRCHQLRRMNLRAALRAEQGHPIGATGSVLNLFWADIEKEMAELHAEVRGALGVTLDDPVSHHLLSSRAFSIYSGTSEIQRNIIAERLLGLPR